ncbi:MAG TPA: DNA N-6-adenine-methyltransferase [Polyangiaceae bacterium]|nr:DNA N-6-adenine-methyltransferase [Polyangiaceae bacterium]
MMKGFSVGLLPGTVTPTSGAHAGTPMLPDSALAQAIVSASRVAESAAQLHEEQEQAVKRRRRMPEQRPSESKQDYATPRALIRAVEHRFGPIAWDLAAHKDNAVCDLWIGEQQDSLGVRWASELGGLLWLNPPFDRIEDFARKCAREAREGARILMLTPASVGANWFWDYCSPSRDALVLALTPRLTFEGETDPYPKDCVVSAYGFGTVGFERWQWRQPRRAL